MKSIAYFAVAALLLLAVAAPVSAQDPAQPQEPADVTAYRPIFEARTTAPKKAIELAEAFLADARPEFWESMWRDNVFLILFDAYNAEKNWVKVLETVDRVEKLVPKTPAQKTEAMFDKIRLYGEAKTIAANQIMDVDKTLDYAKRIKSIDPKNVDALYTLAMVTTEAPKAAAPLDAWMSEIIDNIRAFIALDKPATLADDQWRGIQKSLEIKAQNYVALRYLNKNDFVGCAREYEALDKLAPKDSATLYRLGFCYYNLAKPAYDPVFNAFEKWRLAKNECNDTRAAAYKLLEAMINECNEAKSCTTEENKAKREELNAKFEATDCDTGDNKTKIDDLKEKENVVRKDFEAKRDKAMDALAKSVALAGPGSDAARADLEKLFKIMPEAKFTLEEFVAQKKKELGV